MVAEFFSESRVQLKIYNDRCLRSRLNTNECQRCLESCFSGALGIDNRKITLDTTACTDCMACVAVCPQDALMSDYDLDSLLKLFESDDNTFVSCIHQEQIYPDEVTVPCVGILARQILIAVLLRGCRTISFNVAECARCLNHKTSENFLVNLKRIEQELSSLTATNVVVVDKPEQLQKRKVDRRSYLTNLFDTIISVPQMRFSSNQVTANEDRRNRRRIPFKTQLLKKVLTNVDQNSLNKLYTLAGHDLMISEDCNFCPLCKGICPTGALQIIRFDQGKQLTFTRSDCNGCGLCIEFCKKDALSFKHADIDCPD